MATMASPLTFESFVCKWKTLATTAAEGSNEKQFYLTLATSLIIQCMLIPSAGKESAGYARSIASGSTDPVECRIMRDIQSLPSGKRAPAIQQIVKTFLQEAGITQ